MARGGAGGRIRFRAAKGGHVSDPREEMVRRRNTSRFNTFNSGCFYKSSGRQQQRCPSRLTDYYCVMWTEAPEEAAGADATSVGRPSNSTATATATAATASADSGELLCSGDFTSEGIVLANCFLPLALLILGSALNCLCGRLMLSYSSRQLPVCLYLVLLAGVDTALLWFRFLDLWLQSAFDLKLVLTLALMDESSCQLLNMTYSSLVHFKAALQVALAVDTGRLMRQPRLRFERYTSEWVKNTAILACVLVLLMNAHHLWTLAVVKESPATVATAATAASGSGGSADPENVYYCGWTLRWPITELFATWIWPISDLLVGDVLPAALVVAFCIGGVVGAFRRGRSWQPWRRRLSLAYYVIDVELYCSLQLGLLACCAGYVALSIPGLLRNCATWAAFLGTRLSRPPHLHGLGQAAWPPPPPLAPPPVSAATASAAAASSSGGLFALPSEEVALYIIRLCSGLQLFASPLLLFACVPRFRRDCLAAVCAAFTVGCRRRRHAALAASVSNCEQNVMLG